MTQPRTLYEELEIDRGATEEEVRRAYKRLTQRFDPNGLVLYGLYGPAEAKRLLARLKEAYNTLINPEARRRYDRAQGPKNAPGAAAASTSSILVEKPAAPIDPIALLDLADDVPLNGPVLTQIREICGLSIDDIAHRTKISKFTLRCIEAESWDDLPAPVYLRGFLKQIAQILRIDAQRLWRDYEASLQAWLAHKHKQRPW